MIWALENKFVSILEYDKEWEEKKLRKAEYEAGKSDGIEIGKSEGIEIGRDKTLVEIICNMIKSGFPIEEIAEVMSKVSLKQLDEPCILYNLNGYYNDLKALLNHMIEKGLSSNERQEGIYFAENLNDIKRILKLA